VPTVAVCRKCKGGRRLAELLEDETDACVDQVKCQSICKGPVVGIEVEGQMEWFRKVRGAKTTAALLRLVRRHGRGSVATRLERHRLPNRSGRPPRVKRGATS
jgi:hypothetical protein